MGRERGGLRLHTRDSGDPWFWVWPLELSPAALPRAAVRGARVLQRSVRTCWALACVSFATCACGGRSDPPIPGESYIFDPTPANPPTQRPSIRFVRSADTFRVLFSTPAILEAASGVAGSGWRAIAFESLYAQALGDRRERYFRTCAAVRPIEVYVPGSYRPGVATPLVLLLHGAGGGRQRVEGQLKFRPLAERYGFLLAWPEGHPHSGGRVWNCVWSAQELNVFLGINTADDSGCLRRVVDDCQARLSVDLKRIYVVGYSMGAEMADRLACEHAERIELWNGYSNIPNPEYRFIPEIERGVEIGGASEGKLKF